MSRIRVNKVVGVYANRCFSTKKYWNPPIMSKIPPTAGIIIIGDEILKGQVLDTNSHFISKRLHALGVKLQKISVIDDDVESIANEVRAFADVYTHVITAGGIGPTHDDKTFEGVARAFGEECHPHPHLVEVCSKYFGTDDITSPQLKMAIIPRSAELRYGVDPEGKLTKYPLVTVKNVYIFPGVPSIMTRAFTMLEDLFRNPSTQFHTRQIYVQRDEMSVTKILNEFASRYDKKIALGSYPEFHNSYYKIRLCMESLDAIILNEGYNYLISQLPEGSVVQFDDSPMMNPARKIYSYIETEPQSHLAKQLHQAVGRIEQTFQKYSLSEVCISFNGGKDCTAILHLLLAVINKLYPESTEQLQAFYVRTRMPFPEVEQFIDESKERYNLKMINYTGRIKDSLIQMKAEHPHIKAVFMGSRNTDPHCGDLSYFTPTDADWPPYMRVSPILDWTYHDLWTFMRHFSLHYCSLYDRGYTSLGSMENTHPNPQLRQTNRRGSVVYRPAYLLVDGDQERNGRN